MSDSGSVDCARRLGAELRARRVARGMSLRRLASELGLSGHGTLVDYEHGRRIPPEDLIVAYERVFEVSDGALRNLREKALAERANHQADLLLRQPEQPTEPNVESPPSPPRWRRARWLVVAAVVLLLVVAAGLGLHLLTPSSANTTPSSSAPPPVDSSTVVASWGVCWGGQVGQAQGTENIIYHGAKTLQVIVSKPNSAGDFATCTAHGLKTVHSGTKVTVYLRAPDPHPGDGIGFFVYDSKYKPLWSLETPSDSHLTLSAQSGWQSYTWTVPTVDRVQTLGMEVYSVTDQPLIIWVGAVTW